MKRKQAKRRKPQKVSRIQMPRVPLARVLGVFAATAIVYMTYHFATALLDKPINSVTIDGPFQRVTALQIEEAMSAELDAGFLSANLARIQKNIVALPWIDMATVTRKWPSRIHVSVTEQVPAAAWGERGLLNTRGQLFVTDARHVPAELPRLSGPEERAADVARRYISLREQLIPIGLNIQSLDLDARGAWKLVLQNGVEVRLGRKSVDSRTDLFFDVVANLVTSRAAEIDFVDMRYSNGFSIGWKSGNGAPTDGALMEKPKMLAARESN